MCDADRSASERGFAMAEPRIIKMRVVPNVDETTLAKIAFEGEGTVIMEDARGLDVQVCGNCGAPILRGMQVTLANLALPCMACGAYNEMIPLDDM
jgi:hypothetical protein